MNLAQPSVAIIPCFNEGGSIGPLVTSVRSHLPSVIVVDDGSTDDTGLRATHAGAEVVRHDSNRGKGAALRSGWERAWERGFTWALLMDGDGQHAPDDIPAFFHRAAKTGAPLIIGDRLHQAPALPWTRRQVNRWMTRRLSILLGVALADSQCGFRLVDLEMLLRLDLVSEHFEIESEMLAAFVRAGCKIEFVPIQVIRSQPKQSKIQPLTDGWRWFDWWFRQRRSLRPSAPAALHGPSS